MICPKCQENISEKSKFCMECGWSVSTISRDSAMEKDVFGLKPPPEVHTEEPLDAVDLGNTILQASPRSNQEAEDDIAKDPAEDDLDVVNTMKFPGRENTSFVMQGTPLEDRYEILDNVKPKKGGFAYVAKARDKKLDRFVAVKRLLVADASVSGQEQTVQRFVRESQAIAALNHKNIVQVYDTDCDQDGHYIVMEYINDGSLRDLLHQKGKLAVREAVGIARHVAQGLAYAHRRNLVHRDIKPANIMLSKDGDEVVPKIVDFGLARVPDGSNISMDGFGMGTPDFMPPEQRRSASDVNQTADVYALGKVLYEMVSGEVPANVLPDKIPSPPMLARVIYKCIESKPEERYFSMDDVIQALDSIPGIRTSSGQPSGLDVDGGGLDVDGCPICGIKNKDDARFCAGCGQGLFKSCPECESEFKAGVRFCSSCGTDIDGFEEAKKIAQNIDEFLKDQRWSRIIKECKLLAKDPHFPRDGGKKILASISSIRKKAEEAIEKMERLKKEISSVCDAEDFEEAKNLISSYHKTDPHNQDMMKLALDLDDRIALRDYVQIREQVDELLLKPDFDTASQVLKDYLDEYSDNRFTLAVRDLATVGIPEASSYHRSVKAFEEFNLAEDNMQFDEALKLGYEIRKLVSSIKVKTSVPVLIMPLYNDVAKHLPAEMLDYVESSMERIEDRRKESTELKSAAEKAEKEGAHKKAELLFRQVDEIWPDESLRERIKSCVEQAEIEKGRVEKFRKAVDKIRENIDNRKLVTASGGVGHLRGSYSNLKVNESSEWAPLWKEANIFLGSLEKKLSEAKAKAATFIKEAQTALSMKQYDVCKDFCNKVDDVNLEQREKKKILEEAEHVLQQVVDDVEMAKECIGSSQWKDAEVACCRVLERVSEHVSATEMLALARDSIEAKRRRVRKIAASIFAALTFMAVAAVAVHEAMYFFGKRSYESLMAAGDGIKAFDAARKIADRYEPASVYVEKHSKAMGLMKDAKTAMSAAKNAGVHVELLLQWEKADSLCKDAESAFEKGDISSANNNWVSVEKMLTVATQLAGQRKSKAESERKDCASAREEAISVRAKTDASELWSKAEQGWKIGLGAQKTSRFSEAGNAFTLARSKYNLAANDAKLYQDASAARKTYDVLLQEYKDAVDYDNTLTEEEALFKVGGSTWTSIKKNQVKADKFFADKLWLSASLEYPKLHKALKGLHVEVQVAKLLGQAKEAQKKGNQQTALLALNESLKLDSRNKEAGQMRFEIGKSILNRALEMYCCQPSKQLDAMKLFEQAGAEASYPVASMWLARFKNFGLMGERKDPVAAKTLAVRFFDEVKLLAEGNDGDADACLVLGFAYKYGLGVKENPKEALKSFDKAVKKDYVFACVDLGRMHERDKDYKKAFEQYQKAADAKDTRGMCKLAALYCEEKGVGKNLVTAKAWYDKAVKAGDAEGMYGLGWLYRYGGDGIEQDLEKSFKFLKDAAEGGNVAGMCTLGDYYRYGEGVEKNLSEAREWYKKAADKGDEAAVMALKTLRI